MTTDNVYDNDGKGNPNRIKTWLKMGKWTTEQATLLFLDIDPDTKYGDCFETLSRLGSVQYEYFDDDDPNAGRVPTGCDSDGEYVYLTTEQEDFLRTANKIYKDNVRILNQYEFAAPHEWIGIALEKEISIPWLDWAIKNNLYTIKETDPTSAKYAPGTNSPHTPDKYDDAGTRRIRLYAEIAEIPNYKTIGKPAIRKILTTNIGKGGSCITSLGPDVIYWTDCKGDKQSTTYASLGKWLSRQK